MNNIVIVTNEVNIVDTSLRLVYNDPSFVKIENTGTSISKAQARWVEVINGVEHEMYANPSETNPYNILRIPMAGLVYMVAYARKYDRTEDTNMVVCMKELYPTMLFSMEKYHLFLYGKQKITTNIFEEWFETAEGINPFLTEDFDDIYDMMLEGKFIHLSDAINELI